MTDRWGQRCSAVDTVLVDVCRGRSPQPPEGEVVADELAEAARFHRIAPLVHVALRESHPDLAAPLRADRDRTLMYHIQVSGLIAQIASVLEGMPWLVFKGPVLAEFAHPVPGLRFYKDIDILVSPSGMREATHRLLDSGWRAYVSLETLYSGVVPGEIPLVSPGGIILDLHWSMVVTQARRNRFAATADQLLDRRVAVEFGPTRAWRLDPADSLVHVAQHAALAGAVKLGHVLDADQLARQAHDWDEVVGRARAWQASAQLAVVLGRALRLFGTPVPANLDGTLGLSSPASRLLAVVDRLWPIPPLRHEESVARLVSRAVETRALPTIGAVLGNGLRGIRERVVGPVPMPDKSFVERDVLDDYFSHLETLESS